MSASEVTPPPAGRADDHPDLSLSGRLSQEDRIRIGMAVASLLESDGWRVFEEFLDRRAVDLAKASLYDKNEPRSYYRGRVEELAGIVDGLKELVNEGKRTVRQAKDAQGVVFGMRFGAGDDAASVGDEELIQP